MARKSLGIDLELMMFGKRVADMTRAEMAAILLEVVGQEVVAWDHPKTDEPEEYGTSYWVKKEEKMADNWQVVKFGANATKTIVTFDSILKECTDKELDDLMGQIEEEKGGRTQLAAPEKKATKKTSRKRATKKSSEAK